MEFMWKTSAIFQKEHESRVISVARVFSISQSKHANVKSSGETHSRPIFFVVMEDSQKHCQFKTKMEENSICYGLCDYCMLHLIIVYIVCGVFYC